MPAAPHETALDDPRTPPKLRAVGEHSGITINLDNRGELHLAVAKQEMKLTSSQVVALGDFLHCTQGLWRP